MKSIILTIVFGSLTFLSANAQEKEGVKREGAHQAEFNSDAQDRDGTAEIDSRVQPSEDGENGNSDPGNQIHDAASAANTPGTETRTVSSSGSPGILMTDDEKPDGTNTMQRATLNTVGSPVPGAKGNTTAVNDDDDRSENRVSDGKEQKRIPGTRFVTTPPNNKSKSKKK